MTLIKSSFLFVGSLIKEAKSLLFVINTINIFAWVSISSRDLFSSANSYKAKEYLAAEVSEKSIFLVNFIPLLYEGYFKIWN